MPPTFELRHATLRVRDLALSAAFYVDLLGLRVIDTSDPTIATAATAAAPAGSARDVVSATPPRLALAFPGASVPWLTLIAAPQAPASDPSAARLYHLAVLLADRAHLGAVLQRLASARWPLQGLSDHGVSEALYLADPDGHGLEFYADRPRAAWPRDAAGAIAMFTAAADVRDLLRHAAPLAPEDLFAGARLGHVHLHVTDVTRASEFYRRAFGFDEMARIASSASFLSADGYHHHLAVNTWGHPHRPVQSDTLGLVDVMVAHRARPPGDLVDPDGHRWHVIAAD